MLTFLKANISSLVASAVDYLITITSVQIFSTNPVIGGAMGTTGGGVINFLIGQYWVFVSKSASGYVQGLKYLLVWCGNIALNATGMYLFTKSGSHYIIAKVVTSLLVAVAYNYPLQKYYVLKMIEE